MHFSFNSSNNTTPISRIQSVHGLRACIYYQKHVATIETMSELKFILALLPLQLGMAICYQYERIYITSSFAASAAKWSHTFIPRASNPTTRFSSRLSNLIPRIHQKRSQEVRNPNFFWGACPQTPLAGALQAL